MSREPRSAAPSVRGWHMSFAESVTLDGRQVSLVPLTQAHHHDLVEAAKDGELWNLWYTSVPTPEGMAADIDRRLELQKDGSMLPFAIIENASRAAVGMTTYLNIDAENRRVEIGATWYRKRVQRSGL